MTPAELRAKYKESLDMRITARIFRIHGSDTVTIEADDWTETGDWLGYVSENLDGQTVEIHAIGTADKLADQAKRLAELESENATLKADLQAIGEVLALPNQPIDKIVMAVRMTRAENDELKAQELDLRNWANWVERLLPVR